MFTFRCNEISEYAGSTITKEARLHLASVYREDLGGWLADGHDESNESRLKFQSNKLEESPINRGI
jgi:hypothetical protein